jgi:hypothetical protein
MSWRNFVRARGSGCWSFDSSCCFISTKCGSSISARVLIYGAHAVCFCTLVTILDPLESLWIFTEYRSELYVMSCLPDHCLPLHHPGTNLLERRPRKIRSWAAWNPEQTIATVTLALLDYSQLYVLLIFFIKLIDTNNSFVFKENTCQWLTARWGSCFVKLFLPLLSTCPVVKGGRIVWV